MPDHPRPSSTSEPPEGTAAWRLLGRMAAALLALAIFAYWGAAGFNRGWTKNQVPVTQTDEFTGIEYVSYEKRFVPGIEFLVGGLATCAVIGGLTFLPRKKHQRSSNA